MTDPGQSTADELVDLCYRRAIIYPSGEIYGGLSGFYEIGPIGLRICNSIIDYWRSVFVEDTQNVHEIKGRTLLSSSVFEASGHVDGFSDPMIQCGKCKSIFRADHLLTDTQKNEFQYDGLSLDDYNKLVVELTPPCPKCKSGNDWGDTRLFNLMFSTEVGATGGSTAYFRPETAQNIFTAFRRISHALRLKLPFGIAQVGSVYRNEIAPRNFILRTREFTQLEIEMFVDPEGIDTFEQYEEVSSTYIPLITREMQEQESTENSKSVKPLMLTVQECFEKNLGLNKVMLYFMALQSEMLQNFGVPLDKFWFRHMLPQETPHYSGGNYDLEVQLKDRVIEVVGNAYRQDYDLKRHAKFSNTKMHINQDGKNIVPHVIEPSIGLERILYVILEHNFEEEGRDWKWFSFPPAISPYNVMVLPLRRKKEQVDLAKEIREELHSLDISCLYDDTGQIGKRYARSDEIGITYCITIDLQSLEDETITIRDRNTTKQIRVHRNNLATVLDELIEGEQDFQQLIIN